MIYILLAVVTGWLLFLYIQRIQFRNVNRPPGPFRLPIIGNLLQFLISNPFEPWKVMDNWSKVYGSIYSLQFGSTYVVMLCSYESMRDLLPREEFGAKYSNFIMEQRTFNKELGLISVRNPAIWMEMRKFSQRTLREFGFGKRLSMQGVIEEELVDILKEQKDLLKKSNGILTIKTNFMLSMVNILWSMISGSRYSHDDPKLLELVELTFLTLKTSAIINPVFGFPTLTEWAVNNFPYLTGSTFRHLFFNRIHNFTKSLVEERRRSGVYMSEPQNYIDVFLKKIHENTHDSNSVYTEEQLLIMIEDFFIAGSMTTAATLSFGILYMVLNKDVQKRVQQEIDLQVPRHSIPTIEDIEKMAYTQATIQEIHRLACIVPNPIPRVLQNEYHCHKWKFPKDTLVIPNIYSVLMDKDYWGDPHNFRPERFLNSKGEYIPDKRVIHFGFEKRYCPGAVLVNSIVPIYLTTLLQKFDFGLVPGQPIPSKEPYVGIILNPHPFDTLVTERK